jgi:hypothetical protein
MLSSSALAIIFCVMEFSVGVLIGIGVTVLAYRPRISFSLVSRAGGAAGLAFLVFAIIGGWAGAHESFHNGRSSDVGVNGESLWLRNRIAKYEIAICITGSVLAALLAGASGSRLGRRGSGPGSHV